MKVHYFQRYHSKENVATSNTMLMLSRLYNYNSDKFFTMLSNLMCWENENPEISFDLQVDGGKSVPDAIISQKSFKIVVETKLYNQYDKDQLIRHMHQFGCEDCKVLLTIDPLPMNSQLYDEVKAAVDEFSRDYEQCLTSPIKHINLTFEKLVEAMEDIVDDRDIEILAVLEDFKQYCMDDKLILDIDKWLRAVTASTTINDNTELNLFYEPTSRNISEHGYIGLYSDKSIRAIGKIDKIITAVEKNGKLVYKIKKGNAPTQEEIERIAEAIKRADKYSYNLHTKEHEYFLVDKFYKINFRKSSKYPIQKSKFFNLASMLKYKTMPSTDIIAAALDGKTWEEF